VKLLWLDAPLSEERSHQRRVGIADLPALWDLIRRHDFVARGEVDDAGLARHEWLHAANARQESQRARAESCSGCDQLRTGSRVFAAVTNVLRRIAPERDNLAAFYAHVFLHHHLQSLAR